METSKENVFWDSLKVLDNQHWITESFRGRGDIEFSGNLRFSGTWVGNISGASPEAHLYVMGDAHLKGKIRVGYLSVEGNLDDIDVEAENFRALKGSKIYGRVRAKNMIIEEGAIVEGRIVSQPV